jgi:hypothetical protein
MQLQSCLEAGLSDRGFLRRAVAARTASAVPLDAQKWKSNYNLALFIPPGREPLFDASVPADLDVHVVLDNSLTHKTPSIYHWLVHHHVSRSTSRRPKTLAAKDGESRPRSDSTWC